MQYEINYLVLQSKTADLEKIRKEAKELIESHGAKIYAEKNYLKRKLSYEIKHESYGFFTVLRFEFSKDQDESTDLVQQIKREFNLNQSITRHIIVRAEELPNLDNVPKEKEPEAEETQPAQPATVKQEDIEKMINETKAAPEAKETKKEVLPEPKKQKKEEEKTEQEEVPQKEDDLKEKEETPTKKKATAKKEEKTTPKEKSDKKKPEEENGKASLDELDKKLDEILNI